jgi:hypothetical protein
MRTLAHLKRLEMRRFPALSANLAFALLAAGLLAVSIIVMLAITVK